MVVGVGSCGVLQGVNSEEGGGGDITGVVLSVLEGVVWM